MIDLLELALLIVASALITFPITDLVISVGCWLVCMANHTIKLLRDECNDVL